jgi:hypothetical protein
MNGSLEEWDYAKGNLIRTNTTKAILARKEKESGGNWAEALHGKYREDVARAEHPRMSPVTAWSDGADHASRVAVIRQMLSL